MSAIGPHQGHHINQRLQKEPRQMGKCACQKNANNPTPSPHSEPGADRYVSFSDIDCDGNARIMMALIRKHIDDPARSNAFWEYFKKKAAGGSGPKPDDLFLIHSNLNQIRELFETWEDNEALQLLDRLEIECC